MIYLLLFASVAAPLLMLRGRALRQCLALELAMIVVAVVLTALLHPLHIDFDPYARMVVCAIALLSVVCAFVALASEVRWSANRAGMLALLLYAMSIPLMVRTPIDGDEPFYLLMTESLVRDHDLDLANQYRDLAHSATGRTDLVPQIGDVTGPHGERYAHFEPFLSILLMPGYFLGGLAGALATMAILGALLARSTVRLFEEEGIPDATARALFPLFAFGPPILIFATRIWPEVPAALCFVEAIRGLRQRRPSRWVAPIVGLALLKMRFLLIALPLLASMVRRKRHAALAALGVGVGLLIVWSIAGSGTNLHRIRELLPGKPQAYLTGFFGLLLDGAAGIAFQAPIYLFGLLAITRWRTMPKAFRLGIVSAVLYVITLAPRAEWHGGWSPPLRYIVFLMPVLALGVAALWERIDARPLMIAAAWTLALVIHALTFPWRLFHIANGENWMGEALSASWHSDFSRLFPSFIRPNRAALVASLILIVALAVVRTGRLLHPLLLTFALAAMLFAGRNPGSRVEFEDAHVEHRGGELFPTEYQVQRFLYRGGWIVRPGDALSFLARRGPSVLEYTSEGGATIELGGSAYHLPPTAGGFAAVNLSRGGRVELRCLSGSVNLDRMDHE
ncbi:MAG: hypothetical protein ABIP63_09995 [Thermoanaerobaculia bacterium]